MAPLSHRSRTILLGLAIFCGSQQVSHAGKLRRVWEVDLRKIIDATGGMPEFPVFAVKFSLDGRKLAVTGDVYEAHGARKGRLILIDLARLSAKAHWFEIEFGMTGRGVSLNFGWTPSGAIVYALGKVIHVASGMECKIPSPGVFISNDVAISSRLSSVASSTLFTFYDQNCNEQGKWDVPEAWLISDVSTDRGLLSILRDMGNSEQERLIVDPLARRVLQRWTGKDALDGVFEFADSGKVVCNSGNPLQSDKAPARCRDVDSGKVIGETPRNGDEPIATSTHATRIVVSDYRRRKIPFSYEYDTTFRGLYIWDFGTNQELASWYPEFETYANVFSPGKQIKEQFKFAISPDGQYIAEGGNGILRLYKIEP